MLPKHTTRRAPRVERACHVCDKVFSRVISQMRPETKFCSRACFAKGRTRRPLSDRLWAKVNKDGPIPAHVPDLGQCWEWMGRRSNGYGQINTNDGLELTHRVAYEEQIGPIPDGLYVCHRCDNRACCRGTHFFLGTHADNMKDAVAKGRMAAGDRSAARLHPDTIARGTRRWNAHLTDDSVLAIREQHAAGMTGKDLAVKYNVSQSTISSIIRRYHWKHV